MASQERGGYRPPPLSKLVWRCPECDTFNKAADPTCSKCGAPKVVDEMVSGANAKPLTHDELKLNKKHQH